MLQHAMADRRGPDDKSAIGDGICKRRILSRPLQDILRLHRRFRFAKCDLIRIYQAEFGDAEVAHRARGRTDVQRIAGRDQNHAKGIRGGDARSGRILSAVPAHYALRCTASSTPLIKETDSSPENWRASSSASSITTGTGVFSSFIS